MMMVMTIGCFGLPSLLEKPANLLLLLLSMMVTTVMTDWP